MLWFYLLAVAENRCCGFCLGDVHICVCFPCCTPDLEQTAARFGGWGQLLEQEHPNNDAEVVSKEEWSLGQGSRAWKCEEKGSRQSSLERGVFFVQGSFDLHGNRDRKVPDRVVLEK